MEMIYFGSVESEVCDQMFSPHFTLNTPHSMKGVENYLQEHVNEKSVALVIRGSKLTGQMLLKALRKFLADMNKPKPPKSYKGKQSVKKLIQQGAGVTNAELDGSGVKGFERVARKYGVDFALKKDVSATPPKWLVFFKARDSDAILSAIKEFSAKTVKQSKAKPSLLAKLQKNLETIKDKVIERVKNKDRGRER